MILWIVVGWITCWLYAAGAYCADLQRCAPDSALKHYREDLCFSLGLGLFGPIAAISCTFSTEFLRYGWSLLPYREKSKEVA